MSPFHARTGSSRLGWFAGAEGPDDTPTVLSAVLTGNPATDAVVDYLFGAVAMNGTNTLLVYDETCDRNTSQIGGAPATGGIVYSMATYVTEGNTAVPPATAMGNVIAGFPAGTAVRSGTDILSGYRMFFSAGSRESETQPAAIPLYAGRENLTSTGEEIFLRAVQVALNNGVAPPSDPAAPVGITSQPASVTILQGLSATFSISVTGAAPRTLQWQRDVGDGVTFTNIPDATTPFSKSVYTLPVVSAEDNGARFRLVASNLLVNSVTSEVATLTVTLDMTPPVPLSAGTVDGNTVGVCFNELLDNTEGTAVDTFNYSISEGVSAVDVRPDGRSVVLTLSGPLTGSSFTVTVSGLKDRFTNEMSAPVTLTGTNYGLTSTNVGTLAPAGASFACAADAIEISGGGLDLTSVSDQLQFAYKTVNGDFDARVRVTSLIGTPDHLETTTKAILTARETTDTESAAVNVFITPLPPSDDSVSSRYRASAAAATNNLGATFIPGGLPNGWMRITRVGNVFRTFRGSNGVDWVEFGNASPSLAQSLAVGIGVVSHRNGKLATGTFSDLRIGSLVAAPTLVNASYNAGSFSAAFQTQNGVSYTVRYKDVLNSSPWNTLAPPVSGDGTLKSFTDPGPVSPTGNRFYRVSAP
jgi:hypothetical protein